MSDADRLAPCQITVSKVRRPRRDVGAGLAATAAARRPRSRAGARPRPALGIEELEELVVELGPEQLAQQRLGVVDALLGRGAGVA